MSYDVFYIKCAIDNLIGTEFQRDLILSTVRTILNIYISLSM